MEPDLHSDIAVGAQVRAARAQCGLSLRELARRLGTSPAKLSQIENGKTRLNVGFLGKIAGMLDMTISSILAIHVNPDQPTAPSNTPTRTITHLDETAQQPPTNMLSSRGGEDWRTYTSLDFDPVLTAALHAFLESGYHGATVRDIAHRCELSVSGIYHHYPSKQEMLRTILDLTMTDLLLRACAAREQACSPVGRLSSLVENLALFHTHRRELAFVGASEMRSLEGRNYRQIAGMRQAQQHMVDHEIGSGVALGRFRVQRPHDASRAIVTMCTALAQWFRPTGSLTPEDVSRQYVKYALNLLGCKEF